MAPQRCNAPLPDSQNRCIRLAAPAHGLRPPSCGVGLGPRGCSSRVPPPRQRTSWAPLAPTVDSLLAGCSANVNAGCPVGDGDRLFDGANTQLDAHHGGERTAAHQRGNDTATFDVMRRRVARVARCRRRPVSSPSAAGGHASRGSGSKRLHEALELSSEHHVDDDAREADGHDQVGGGLVQVARLALHLKAVTGRHVEIGHQPPDVSSACPGATSALRAMAKRGPRDACRTESTLELRDVVDPHRATAERADGQCAHLVDVPSLILLDADLHRIPLATLAIVRDLVIARDHQTQRVVDGRHPHAEVGRFRTVYRDLHLRARVAVIRARVDQARRLSGPAQRLLRVLVQLAPSPVTRASALPAMAAATIHSSSGSEMPKRITTSGRVSIPDEPGVARECQQPDTVARFDAERRSDRAASARPPRPVGSNSRLGSRNQAFGINGLELVDQARASWNQVSSRLARLSGLQDAA